MKLILTILLIANLNFTYGYMPTELTLYSDPECLCAVTTLPETYFVIVHDFDSDTGTYKVSYKDLSGYMRGIEVVDYEPVTKFASARFTVNNDGYPAKLRSEPSETSEVLVEIPSGKSGAYYGEAQGSVIIEQVGGKWYFVSYTVGLDTFNGYIYSSQATVSPAKANIIEKVEHNDKSEENTSSPVESPDFVLITLLCVPSVLIMYLVFKDKERKPRYKE